VRRAPTQLGETGARWTLAQIRRVCSWLRLHTDGGRSALLKRLKIRYKWARHHVHSPDKNYLAKLRDIQVCVRQALLPDGFVLLFMDEFSYTRQPLLGRAYEAMGPDQALAQLGHSRNKLWRVVATLDALTGQVHYLQQQKITVPALVRFYQQVVASYPQAQTLAVVQDNWPVHFHPDVLAALQPQTPKWPVHMPPNWPTEPSPKAKRLNLPIRLLQLPTYASWCNPIEKLWRKLSQEELALHDFQDDWDGLRQHVADWLDQFKDGSAALLRYVGLTHPTQLYQTAFARAALAPPVTDLIC
jgi:hypothetical protein